MHTSPRVLFVVGFLTENAGISLGLIRLGRELMKHGWEVALASATDEKNEIISGPRSFQSYGIKHFFVPFPRIKKISPKNIIQIFPALLQLNAAVREFQPDIINVHSLTMCPYAQFVRLKYKIPFVSTARIEPLTDSKIITFSGFINKHFSTFLGDRFIAISTEIKDVYQKTLKVPPEKIRLICHGVDSEYFRPPSSHERLEARKAFKLDSEAKVVCLIGRLNPVKGHDVLVRALSMLRAKGIEAIALCAGTGIWEDSVRAQAAEAGVADLVRLIGHTDPRQVIWASDILTLPSRREGFGWVIPEAMLCGVVPVRTPSAGAIDQIEDGVNGFIVPFDDPEALAIGLEQLLENNELRSKMSAAALKLARLKFTANRMTKDTIALYEEVINESSHRK